MSCSSVPEVALDVPAPNDLLRSSVPDPAAESLMHLSVDDMLEYGILTSEIKLVSGSSVGKSPLIWYNQSDGASATDKMPAIWNMLSQGFDSLKTWLSKGELSFIDEELMESARRGYGIVLAGGSVVRRVADTAEKTESARNLHDLDLFMFGFTDQTQADTYALNLVNNFRGRGFYAIEMLKVIQFQKGCYPGYIGPEPTPAPTIQLILRNLPEVGQILNYFDIPICQMAYNGYECFCTIPSAWCFANRIMLVDTTRNSPNLAIRLNKYHSQVVPSFSVRFHSTIELGMTNYQNNIVDFAEMLQVKQSDPATVQKDTLLDEYANDIDSEEDTSLVKNDTIVRQAKRLVEMLGRTSATTPFGLFVKVLCQQYSGKLDLGTGDIKQQMKESGYTSVFSYANHLWQTMPNRDLYIEMSRVVRRQKFSPVKPIKKPSRRLYVADKKPSRRVDFADKILIKDHIYQELRHEARKLRRLRRFDQGDLKVVQEAYLQAAKVDDSYTNRWATSKKSLDEFVLDMALDNPTRGASTLATTKLDISLDQVFGTDYVHWFPDLNLAVNKVVGLSPNDTSYQIIPMTKTDTDISMSSNWIIANLRCKVVDSSSSPQKEQYEEARRPSDFNWRNLILATVHNIDFTNPQALSKYRWHLKQGSEYSVLDLNLNHVDLYGEKSSDSVCLDYVKIYQSLGIKKLEPKEAKVYSKFTMHDHQVYEAFTGKKMDIMDIGSPSRIDLDSSIKLSNFYCKVFRNLNLLNQHIKHGRLGPHYAVDMLDPNQPRECIWNWRPVSFKQASQNIVTRTTMSEILLLCYSQYLSDDYHKIISEHPEALATLDASDESFIDKPVDCRGTPFGDFLFEQKLKTVVPLIQMRGSYKTSVFNLIWHAYRNLPESMLCELVERYPDHPSGLTNYYW